MWPQQEEGYLSISTDCDRNRHFATRVFKFPVLRSLLFETLDKWATGNLWFTIGVLGIKPRHGRGGTSIISGIPGLVADIDCTEDVHNQEELPTKDQALGFISEIPLKPSMIVWSGGGFHVYWLFEEVWMFETPEEREQAKLLSKRWQQFIMARGKEKGWKLNNVGSLGHLVRIPGTYNHKRARLPVKIIAKNYFTYSFDSIVSFLDEPTKERCVNRCDSSFVEADRCRMTECQLYPFRSGKGRQDAKAQSKAIRDYCSWCMATERASRCIVMDCPLFCYRKSTVGRP